jgi:hypothetical protein
MVQDAPQQAVWNRLRDWCHEGAGPGHTTWWRPWALPAVAQRLKVAVWAGDEAKALRPLLNDFCLDIDGSHRLHAMPNAWAGRAWRVQIKLRELAWWSAAQQHRPWDAGYLITTDAATTRLVTFRPRRATLIVMKGLSKAQEQVALGHLQNQQTAYAHAVRVLVLNETAKPDLAHQPRV